MAKHVYASKSEVAYAELREKILIGDLEAGSRLSPYAIADELQISITPLREAIRRLHGEAGRLWGAEGVLRPPGYGGSRGGARGLRRLFER